MTDFQVLLEQLRALQSKNETLEQELIGASTMVGLLALSVLHIRPESAPTLAALLDVQEPHIQATSAAEAIRAVLAHIGQGSTSNSRPPHLRLVSDCRDDPLSEGS